MYFLVNPKYRIIISLYSLSVLTTKRSATTLLHWGTSGILDQQANMYVT